MEPITTLTGYIISRLLHGIRIFLLTATPMFFLSHESIARNIKNKAPTSEDGGGTLRAVLNMSQRTSPENATQALAYTGKHPDHIIQQESKTQIQALSSLNEIAAAHYPTTSKPQQGDALERAYTKLQSHHILLAIKKNANASDTDMQLFINYYYDKIYGTDRSLFWQQVENGQIVSDADITSFAQQKIDEYTSLLLQFMKIEKEYPSSVAEYAHRQNHSPMGTCNPACDNIGFESGNLTAWNTYYAQNTSSTSFTSTTPVGGLAGSVTNSAYDPNTLDYQVSIMSGGGFDPVAGSLIPVVCPTGGSYSVRIGDSTRNGAQIGVLEQTFMVTPTNSNFTYMYAVVLENPGHTYYEQPYFNVQILDQSGNPIGNCGNYSVVSGPGLPGYIPIYYAPDADTVYCKPWSTVFVPLQSYIGQCVTLKLTASDCAWGGHFGYAYFDATCSPGVIASSPAICGNNITLTAPSGAATYQWFGPCIIGSTTSQTITVGCAGVYKVAVTSIANSGCSDTIVDTVKGSTAINLSIISHTNVSCNGGNNGSAVANATGGTPPFTYSWLPSGGSSANATNLTAGTYTVKVTDATGCTDTASVTITQPAPLVVTSASSNVTCNGDNNGSITLSGTGGTLPYTYSWLPNVSTSAYDSNLTAGTYTIVVTDANNCTSTVTITITQPAPMVVTINSHHNVTCHGDNNGAAVAFASGGTSPYNYAWSNGQSTKSSTSLTAGTYTVVVTDANGCTGTDSIIIGEPPVLVVTATVTNVSCNGGNNGTASASASGGTAPYTYSWNTKPVQTTSTINTLPVGVYVVTATDSNGCTGTDTVTITQPSPVTLGVTSIINVSCNGGNNGAAIVVAGGGVGPYSYTWTPSVSSSSKATNLTANVYTVVATDANGCTSSITITIAQPPALVATSFMVNVTCNGGNNGSITLTTTGGVSPYNYTWTPSVSAGSSASNLSADAYKIVITDANGCSLTENETITQPTALITAITSQTNVSCNLGNNGSIYTSTNGGTNPYTYAWVPKVSSGANATGLSAGNYTLTVTDANGCTSAINTSISQPQPITIVNSSVEPSCNGSENGSISAFVVGGTPAYNYVWTTSPPQYTSNATGIGAGIYILTVTDANGCVKNDTVTLLQPAVLTTNITGVTNEKCYGDSNGSAAASVAGGTKPYNYVWSTTPVKTTPALSGLKAGSYTVNITDAKGCTSNASVTITQPTPVTTLAFGPDSICSGTTVTITAIGNGGTGSYTFKWSTGTGSISTQNVTPDSSTTYTVTAVDANGCVGTPAAITIGTWNLGAANLTISPPQKVCMGDTITLYAYVTNANAGSPSITWSNGYTGNGPFQIVPYKDSTFTITAANKCGAVVTKTIPVTVNTLPVIHIPLQTGASCNAVTLNFKDTNSANSADTYEWNMGNGDDESGNSVSATYDQSGTYTITVTVTSPEGCKAEDVTYANVTVYPTAKAVFTPDPKVAPISNPVITFIDASTNTNSWAWDFGDGAKASYTSSNRPVHTYRDTGKYVVTLVTNNNYGCMDKRVDTVEITPEFTFFIPNAFSPNGDGDNDFFTGKGIGIRNFHMMIFDRWGMMIFETYDINQGWDGHANGGADIAQQDTYVYRIEITDVFHQQHSYLGAVTLIK